MLICRSNRKYNNNMYNHSLSNYTGSHDPITIIRPLYGPFEQIFKFYKTFFRCMSW